MSTVRIQIVNRTTQIALAVVEVEKPSGQKWLREAVSTAVLRWRRETGDHATAVRAELADPS